MKKYIIIVLLLAHSSCSAAEGHLLDSALSFFFGDIVVVPKDNSAQTRARVCAKLCGNRSQPKLCTSRPADDSGKEVEVTFEILPVKMPFFADQKFYKRLAER